MKLKMHIKYFDGVERDVEAIFADFVGFERTWNRSVKNLDTEIRLTDVAWLAWHSEKRRGMTTEPFDPEWIRRVEIVTLVESEEEATEAPLDPEASIG